MLVNARHKLPVYQVIGPVVRVHWDYQEKQISGMDGEDSLSTMWDCQEAVVPIDADYDTFVRVVNEEGGDGESLATDWFADK
jgi:hypothetical protein